MCGHWLRLHQFCLWIWLNRQRIAHLCTVKRLTKLKSVPNICGGTKKRDKQIGQFEAPSRCWKGSYNILQHQAKRPENLKVFDRMQTNSSNQVKQPLCGSFPKCECSKNRMTMRQHERQGTAMNNRERPWIVMNDNEWSQMAWKHTSHPSPYHRSFPQNAGHAVLSVRFVLHHWLQFPSILANRPHSARNNGLSIHTHTHDWAYLCFIMLRYSISEQLLLEETPMAGHSCRCVTPVLSLTWLHRQHFVHLCKVTRLTKLQSVPNICGGTKKRDKHIRQFAAPSRCWKGSYNILQHQAKRPENLKAFDGMPTNSSNQVKQPLCGSFPKCECSRNRMTMRQHERQPTAMNNRERPWMVMNDNEWSQMAWKHTSHPSPYHRSFPQNGGHAVLSVRFVLHHWLQFPSILANRPHSACNYGLSIHTHTWLSISMLHYASIFHI